jgi:hypothetical protein
MATKSEDAMEAANIAREEWERKTGKRMPPSLLMDIKKTYEKRGAIWNYSKNDDADRELDEQQISEVLLDVTKDESERKMFQNSDSVVEERRNAQTVAIGNVKKRVERNKKQKQQNKIATATIRRKPEKKKESKPEPKSEPKHELKSEQKSEPVADGSRAWKFRKAITSTKTKGTILWPYRKAKVVAGSPAGKKILWPYRKAKGVPTFVRGPAPIPKGLDPTTAKYDSDKHQWTGDKIQRPEKPAHLKYGYVKPKVPESEGRAGRLRTWFSRRKEGTKYRLQDRAFNKAEKQRDAINMRTKTDYWKDKISPITNVSNILPQVGFSLPGPFKVFTLAWQKMTTVMKLVVVLVFFLAILFIPWGIFYYAGWAVGAAVMFLISLIYWAFANLFNAIATGIVGVINGVITVFMGFIIWIVEAIMGIFMHNYHENGRDMFMWYNGRGLMENSLISYTTVAQVPNLLTIEAPKWQNWFNTTLIVKIFELVPGLQGFVDAYNNVVVGAIEDVFSGFVGTAPGWQVILIGLAPILAIVAIVIVVYMRNRKYFY